MPPSAPATAANRALRLTATDVAAITPWPRTVLVPPRVSRSRHRRLFSPPLISTATRAPPRTATAAVCVAPALRVGSTPAGVHAATPAARTPSTRPPL